jgi:hypothetical protein
MKSDQKSISDITISEIALCVILPLTLWFIVTVFVWVGNVASGKDQTLLENIISQCRFITLFKLW